MWMLHTTKMKRPAGGVRRHMNTHIHTYTHGPKRNSRALPHVFAFAHRVCMRMLRIRPTPHDLALSTQGGRNWGGRYNID